VKLDYDTQNDENSLYHVLNTVLDGNWFYVILIMDYSKMMVFVCA